MIDLIMQDEEEFQRAMEQALVRIRLNPTEVYRMAPTIIPHTQWRVLTTLLKEGIVREVQAPPNDDNALGVEYRYYTPSALLERLAILADGDPGMR